MAGKRSPALFELIGDRAVGRQPKVGALSAPAEEAASPATPPASSPSEPPLTPPATPSATPGPASQPKLSAPAPIPAPEPVRIASVAEPQVLPPREAPAPREPEPARASPAPRPLSTSRSDPKADWNEPTPPSPRARTSSPGRSQGFQWGAPVSISTSVLCLVAAGILVSWIVLWSAAYNVGFRRGDDRASRELSLSAAPVTDPLMGDQTVGEGVIATRPSPPTSQPAAIQPSARQPAAPAGATARLAGTQGVRGVMVPPEPEPRVAGLNYYAIEGQLDRESAQLIVAFLAEHNVASVAVDTSPRGSNNQRSYRVYGLQGFSSAEFRSPGRTEYEQRISQLGEIFRNDPRGWTDFSRTNWERF